MSDAAPRRPGYDLAGADHDYPLRAGAPIRSILVCSHPRSGSTLLGEALYFARGLGCPLEYFHVGFRPSFERRWAVTGVTALRDALWQRRTDPNGTLSAKIFWRDVCDIVAERAPGRLPLLDQVPASDVDPGVYRDVAELLADIFPAPAYIHLRRNDLVRQAVSGLVAVESGVFRAIPAIGDPVPYREPAYDFARIDGLVAHARFCDAHWQAYFRANHVQPHALAYEDLVSDYAGAVDAVLRHLGSAATAQPVRMKRQSDARTEAMVVRFIRETAARRPR